MFMMASETCESSASPTTSREDAVTVNQSLPRRTPFDIHYDGDTEMDEDGEEVTRVPASTYPREALANRKDSSPNGEFLASLCKVIASEQTKHVRKLLAAERQKAEEAEKNNDKLREKLEVMGRKIEQLSSLHQLTRRRLKKRVRSLENEIGPPNEPFWRDHFIDMSAHTIRSFLSDIIVWKYEEPVRRFVVFVDLTGQELLGITPYKPAVFDGPQVLARLMTHLRRSPPSDSRRQVLVKFIQTGINANKFVYNRLTQLDNSVDLFHQCRLLHLHGQMISPIQIICSIEFIDSQLVEVGIGNCVTGGATVQRGTLRELQFQAVFRSSNVQGLVNLMDHFWNTRPISEGLIQSVDRHVDISFSQPS